MSSKTNDFETVGGYTDSRGEWRPENPVSYAPVFVWPPSIWQFLTWLGHYLLTWNLLYLLVTVASYYWLQPPLEAMKTFKISWILTLFFRNMGLVWLVYGSWHLYLYILRKRGAKGKYNPRWQSTDGSTFLWNNQVYDNVFWACASAVPIWTAYEVVTFWLYANGKLPYLDFAQNPVWFILLFLLIPIWREFHFYLIHRLIHWKPLYDKVHYLHHYNINPGPWSGLAMHPVEHLLYFSVVLIHFIVPSHPLHFLFNSQHTALTPAAGHSGFEGKLGRFLAFGSYFHYLHHRLFECNYGEATIPLDKWFGIFEDGSKTQTEKLEASSAFKKLRVTKIVNETQEVKSFYFESADGKELTGYAAGQYLTLKVPLYDKQLCVDGQHADKEIRYALRNYTLSSVFENNQYRVSIKREPGGLVSNALHDSLRVGHVIEARGPKGSFLYHFKRRKPAVFIAGGIGITPILPMLKSIGNTEREMYLFLAVKERPLLSFSLEIASISQQNPDLKIFVFYSRQSTNDDMVLEGDWQFFYKRLDIDSLKRLLPDKKHFDFYLCGPQEMTETLIEEIEKWKGKKCSILTEDFKSFKREQNERKLLQVHFSKSGKTIDWDHDYRNLLEFAESNGIRMEAGCMFGECGACSTNIIDGKVDYNYKTAIKPAKGKCLPCSCFPESDITIEA